MYLQEGQEVFIEAVQVITVPEVVIHTAVILLAVTKFTVHQAIILGLPIIVNQPATTQVTNQPIL
jgi:hypothetical protein